MGQISAAGLTSLDSCRSGAIKLQLVLVNPPVASFVDDGGYPLTFLGESLNYLKQFRVTVLDHVVPPFLIAQCRFFTDTSKRP
jgi:hypothetical protein